MATKKAAPKASAKKKTVTKSTFATAITPPVVPETKVGKMTWGNVVKTDMKKPRSWQDWQARQLDENRLK